MSKQETILVLGGTGNTGSRIGKRLTELGYNTRIASRGNALAVPVGAESVYFDWHDPKTHLPALKNVNRLYMVAPLLQFDLRPVMLPFLDLALQNGVHRVVLLSSLSIPEGGPVIGEIHQAIRELSPEWAVLQPAYFMQNFLNQHAPTIKNDGVIITATGEGRIGFVDAADIAEVGVHALIDEVPHNTAHQITGPQALNYAEAAKIIENLSGITIEHQQIEASELAERFVSFGMPDDYARFLASLEDNIRYNGTEDLVTDTVKRVTGRAPRSLFDFMSDHQDF